MREKPRAPDAASAQKPLQRKQRIERFPIPELLRPRSRSAELSRKKERKARQEQDEGLQELKKIAKSQWGWNRLLGKSNYETEQGETGISREEWGKFKQRGVLFFSGGYVAVRSVRTDEERLERHSEQFKEKKYRQAIKKVGAKKKLPSYHQISIYQNRTEALRGIIHTHIGELKAREQILSELIDVIKDIDKELVFRGRSLDDARVERLRLRYAEAVELAAGKEHFYTKRGRAKLERGFGLWDSGNFPALSWVMAAGRNRFIARASSISPVVAKSEGRLELFKEHLRRQLKREKDANRKLEVIANLCAIKMWKRWAALHEMKWQLAKCFSDERNEAVNGLKRKVYEVQGELKNTKNAKSVGALFKKGQWAFFHPDDRDAINEELRQAQEKKQKPDFERIFRHVSASYWQWKFNAVLRDDMGEPVRGRAFELAHDFKPGEFRFPETLEAQRMLADLCFLLDSPEARGARERLAKAQAGKEHSGALEEFKRQAAGLPPFSELAGHIAKVQEALEQFRAEEAFDRALAGMAGQQIKND